MIASTFIRLVTISALAIRAAALEVKEYHFPGLPTLADFKSQNQTLELPATLFEDVFKINLNPSSGSGDWASSKEGQPPYDLLRRKYDVAEKGGYIARE